MASITRTWIVDTTDAAAIARLADAHGLNHSQLVRYLLRYGLTAVASGDLTINKRPVRWELVPGD